MTAIRTQIGGAPQAEQVPFHPPSGIPATNVWDAINYIWNNLKAAIAALTSSLSAPQYLVATSDATLANERVATDTATIAWDFSGDGQGKANVPDGAISTAKLADAAAATAKIADGAVTFGKLNSATFDTDGTLAGNSDSKFPTQKAVKTYADAIVTLFSGALVFKGSFDASSGSFPGGGTAKIGYFYKVSVAGTVNGQAFDVGDDLYAITNNATTSTYAGNWLLIQGVLSSAEIIAALASGAIANAKLANVATSTFKGRVTAGTGAPEDLTTAQATALLDTFGASGSGHKKGLVPDPGASAGTTKFLREDGSFAVPPFPSTLSAFRAHNAADLTGIPASTITNVTWDTEKFDKGNNFASSAWTPPAGLVRVAAQVRITGAFVAGAQTVVIVAKNGAEIARGTDVGAGTAFRGIAVETLDIANGTDVYTVQVFTQLASGTGTLTTGTVAGQWSWFEGVLLSS